MTDHPSPRGPRFGDALDDKARLDKMKPHYWWTINGQKVPMWTTGQLAEMLGGRSATTIRKWLWDGLFPETDYIYTPERQGLTAENVIKGSRRLYTTEMVLGVCGIAREEGVFEKDCGIKLNRTRFPQRCADLFTRLMRTAA